MDGRYIACRVGAENVVGQDLKIPKHTPAVIGVVTGITLMLSAAAPVIEDNTRCMTGHDCTIKVVKYTQR